MKNIENHLAISFALLVTIFGIVLLCIRFTEVFFIDLFISLLGTSLFFVVLLAIFTATIEVISKKRYYVETIEMASGIKYVPCVEYTLGNYILDKESIEDGFDKLTDAIYEIEYYRDEHEEPKIISKKYIE